MNATLTTQLFLFLIAGAMLIAVSLQVTGDYNLIGEIREVLGTNSTAA